MKRWLLITWAVVAAPFWVVVATGGPDGLLPHAIFHLVYPLFAVAAVFVLVRLRSLTQSSVVRGLAMALMIAQVGLIVGHIGEGISVFANGGLNATEAVFDEPFHMWSARLTFPGVMLSQLLLIALTVAAVVAGRRALRRRPAVA